MNLPLIEFAANSYMPHLDEQDNARLSFFLKLWRVMAACQEELYQQEVEGQDGYRLPDRSLLNRCYQTETPVLLEAPVTIDEPLLATTLDRLSQVFIDEGSYPVSVIAALQRVKWDRVLRASNLSLAGSNPSAWLEELGDILLDDGMDPTSAGLSMLITSLALKIQLEEPAAHIMKALENGKELPHALLCPVCGSAPYLAHVGGETSSDGRGRLLVCPQCGAAWEFERIRCTRCGTRHQRHLHYYNIEGDDAHRIATCDECGGYMRTLFSEDALAPCSYEVEDVVMARLDALAQNEGKRSSLR